MNYQIGNYVGASVDLDSTALWQGELSPINASAAQELDDNGFHNVITTGRHLLQSINFYHKLACKGPIVTSDGASVLIPGGDVLQQHFIAKEVYPEILEIARRRSLSCLCYCEPCIYVQSKLGGWDESMEMHKVSGGLYLEDQFLGGHPPHKLFLFGKAPVIDGFQNVISAEYPVDCVRLNPKMLDVMPRGVNKGAALQVVAEFLGVSVKEFIAFGDGNNDIETFRRVGFSVCMSHGTERAKAAATIVAPKTSPEVNFAAGVTAAMKHLSGFDL